MFDCPKFIQIIEKYPTIWDKTIADYSNRVKRDKCWEDVGKQTCDTWPLMTPHDRRLVVIEMKNKWRNVRDNYMRTIHSDAARKKGYCYGGYLRFLSKPGVCPRRRPNKSKLGGNKKAAKYEEESEDTHQDAESSDMWETSTVTMKGEPDWNASEDGEELGNTFHDSVTAELLEDNETADPLDSLEASYQDGGHLPQNSAEEADSAFLMSLLPYLRSLNDDQKLDFRIHTLQYFKQLRNK